MSRSYVDSRRAGSARLSRVVHVAAIAVTLAGPAPTHAQPARTCQEEPEFRQFDFWAGEWEVFNNQTNARAGSNTIEVAEGGCVLIEHWQAAGGGTGTSMNYYDNVLGQWRQVWVAANYVIDVTGGLDAEGAMVLEGELHNFRFRRNIPFRGTWTPLPNGDVRQLFEQQDPATGEWRVWFDGRYERRDG